MPRAGARRPGRQVTIAASRATFSLTLLVPPFIHSIYHKSQQVYTEKEIIALAAKAGVNANSIPEIHQSLVDDGLVEKEKIGGSNYCWSFKAKKDRMAQKAHQQTLDMIQELKPQVEEASAQLADAKRGREEEQETPVEGAAESKGEEGSAEASSSSSTGRADKLRRLAELEQRKTKVLAELETLKENDPAALADLEKEFQLVTAAAHRWTDNIFECKLYLVKKRGMEKKEAMRILGIPASFDCKLFRGTMFLSWLATTEWMKYLMGSTLSFLDF